MHLIPVSEKAIRIARYADDQKAGDIVVLDVQGLANYTDFFVICTGRSQSHLRAISQEIEKQLRRLGERGRSALGCRETKWILLDYQDVVVHIFERETREFYSLDRLWGDARVIDWSAEHESLPSAK